MHACMCVCRNLNIYVFIYVGRYCMHACMHVCVCVCVCVCACVDAGIGKVFDSGAMRVCVHVFVWCVYVMYVGMHAGMYIFLYINT